MVMLKTNWNRKFKNIMLIVGVAICIIIYAVYIGNLKTECDAKGGHLVEDYRGMYICTE